MKPEPSRNIVSMETLRSVVMETSKSKIGGYIFFSRRILHSGTSCML